MGVVTDAIGKRCGGHEDALRLPSKKETKLEMRYFCDLPLIVSYSDDLPRLLQKENPAAQEARQVGSHSLFFKNVVSLLGHGLELCISKVRRVIACHF